MARVNLGKPSRDELERALHSVDEKLICEYFQRGELWSLQVPPVLLAMATLQAMLRSTPAAHYQCYSQSVQLLEYIHSECPLPGIDQHYIDLLVDFKTRAALYEVFQEVSLTAEVKEDVLTRYLGPVSPQKEITYTNTEEYSVHRHAYARHSLENMLASDQQSLAFRRTHLFNSDDSRMVNSTLLSDLASYLAAVCKHFMSATASHNRNTSRGTSASNNHPEADACDNTKDVCSHVQQTSHKRQATSVAADKSVSGSRGIRTGAQHDSGVTSRRNRKGAERRKVNQRATDTTATTSSTEEEEICTSRGVGTHVHYNLRRRRGTSGASSDDREGQEPHDNARKSKEHTIKMEEEENECGEGEIDRAGTLVIHKRTVRQGHENLSPHTAVETSCARTGDHLPVTSPRSSVRPLPRRIEERGKKKNLRLRQRRVNHTEDCRETKGVELGSVEPLREETGHYHLRRRGNASYESETETTETEDVAPAMTLRPVLGRKRKKSMSSDPLESSEQTTGMRITVSNRSPRLRPLRRVNFYGSPGSSGEEGFKTVSYTPSRQKKTSVKSPKTHPEEHSGKESSKASLNRSRRKQSTPRKLLESPGQKLTSKVHFSQTSEDKEPLCGPSDSKTSTRRSSRRSTSQTVISSSSESNSSECETVGFRAHSRRSRTRHLQQLSDNTTMSSHRVVNLADPHVEQSQPNSQWDYVAVQTVAAVQPSPAHPVSPTAGRRTRFQCRITSDTDSDHEHVSLISDEVVLVTRDQQAGSGGDRLSVVSESSRGSMSPSVQPALQSIRSLRKQAV